MFYLILNRLSIPVLISCSDRICFDNACGTTTLVLLLPPKSPIPPLLNPSAFYFHARFCRSRFFFFRPDANGSLYCYKPPITERLILLILSIRVICGSDILHRSRFMQCNLFCISISPLSFLKHYSVR